MSPVSIAEFDKKVELLRASPQVVDFASREFGSKAPTGRDLCEWMRRRGGTPKALNHTELTKSKQTELLTAEHARSFLLAFGVQGVPARLDDSWLELLKKPAETFRLIVRLRGGECPGPLPGALWDEFFSPERQRSADEAGCRMVTLLRPERYRQPASPAFDRVLPHGARNPIGTFEARREEVVEGEKIAFRLDLEQALLRTGQFCHLRVVQEVQTAGKRMFLPLVPYPGEFGAIMPPTQVVDKSVCIPADINRHALVVPSNWGPLRRILVIVTRRDLVLEEGTVDQVEVSPGFMDLLADQLMSPSLEFALLRFEYLVRPSGTK